MLPEIGEAGQARLKAARVLVAGAGGLGCPILQYFAAAGVGTIGIADGDVVSLSNLQRQVLYTPADIGQGKARCAASVVAALNPFVSVAVHDVFIDHNNVLDICAGYDIIVDGSDNFDTRYLLNDACVMLGKPLVSGAIFRFEGQVSVFNYKGGPTYRCLFPQPPGEGESPNCAEIGVVATLPGIVGTMQANEVIKMITGTGEVLSGRLLVIDALTMSTHTFRFGAVEENRHIGKLHEPSAKLCEWQVPAITYAELREKMSEAGVQLVDVREAEEHGAGNIGGINLPLSGFEPMISALDTQRPVILYCASGKRSMRAAGMLVAAGFGNVCHLAGGVGAIALQHP